MPLKVAVEEKPGGTFIVRPDGSIDAATHSILGSEVDTILAKSPKVVIFDMRDVVFVSSAGVGVVLQAEKTMMSLGGETLMVNAKPPIKKVFEIVQALPSQRIFTSVQEMDRYLAAIQKKMTGGEEE